MATEIVPPLPKGHQEGLGAAARELADFINELPDGFYHMSPFDTELAARRVVAAYQAALERNK